MPALKDFLTLLEWFCYGCLFLHVIIVLKLCCTWRREGHLSFFNHGFVYISKHTHTHKQKSNKGHKSPSNFDSFPLSRFLHMIGLSLPTAAFMVIIVIITSIIISINIFITSAFQVYHLFQIGRQGMDDTVDFYMPSEKVLIQKKKLSTKK